MQKIVAIVGAGGKMGARAAGKIGLGAGYRVLMCESDSAKAHALAEQGFEVTPPEKALAEADFAVLAVPDALIGQIAHDCAPLMKQGSTLIVLDAAAAYVGEMPSRKGITMMITHPCHPPFFSEQATPEARADYFGGTAVQDILVCMIEGSEENFSAGAELCKAIFAPVKKAHRVTAEQFALLEPAMSEIVVATAACWMKASLDEAIKHGVPREAAEAFMAGHAQIAMAIAFGAEKSPFSDAALLAVEWGTRELVNPEWRKAFERQTLTKAIHFMLHPQKSR